MWMRMPMSSSSIRTEAPGRGFVVHRHPDTLEIIALEDPINGVVSYRRFLDMMEFNRDEPFSQPELDLIDAQLRGWAPLDDSWFEELLAS